MLIRSPLVRASNEYPQCMFSWRNKKNAGFCWLRKCAFIFLSYDDMEIIKIYIFFENSFGIFLEAFHLWNYF